KQPGARRHAWRTPNHPNRTNRTNGANKGRGKRTAQRSEGAGHTLTVPSPLVVTNRRPSGQKATPSAVLRWPRCVASRRGSSTAQQRTAPSSCVVASSSPSGENATPRATPAPVGSFDSSSTGGPNRHQRTPTPVAAEASVLPSGAQLREYVWL